MWERNAFHRPRVIIVEPTVTCDEHLRRQLDLDTSSRVVIIATEGATDPKVYENIVGTRPARIDIKRI
ncbi:MAG: hypothetical protein O7E52_09210 [Candidatus Poribacteria bacterium]|nr:hypothetical protein [Candidatus Poribacteria bacterium]